MHRTTLLAAATALALALPGTAFAYGALAIGTDYPTSGGWTINVGYGVQYNSTSSAENRAMNECSSSGRGTRTARNACKVVTNFSSKCFAVAIDTQTGAFGWSVRDGLSTAKDRSVENCVQYGGARGRCKVSYQGCDM